MKRHALVRFHEIALKGKNRGWFVNVLADNLRRATAGLGVERVWKRHMLLGLSLEDGAEWDPIRRRLERVFGVVNFSPAWRVSPDLEEIRQAVGRVVSCRRFESFKVDANRADKSFPLTSIDLNRDLGRRVCDITGARVDLRQPDLTVFVDLHHRDAYICTEKVPGPGGLPVGVGGRVSVLLSGGIDSPVAAWYLLKRGCQIDLIHFHSHPLVDTSSMEKAAELAEVLAQYGGPSRLFLAPLSDIQRRLIPCAPPGYRVLLYRRFMVRIAEALARREGARALVTGESLGQVSSQTLENMVAVEQAAGMPVLRPLVGFDKQEIVARARRLGTYEVSIRADQDCCSLFVPPHPVTRAEPGDLERLEEKMDVEGMVREAVEATRSRACKPAG